MKRRTILALAILAPLFFVGPAHAARRITNFREVRSVTAGSAVVPESLTPEESILAQNACPAPANITITQNFVQGNYWYAHFASCVQAAGSYGIEGLLYTSADLLVWRQSQTPVVLGTNGSSVLIVVQSLALLAPGDYYFEVRVAVVGSRDVLAETEWAFTVGG